MKKTLLLLSFLFFQNLFSQIPTPPGYQICFAVDDNNDGYAQFDINYYLNTYIRNHALAYYGYNLNAYQLELYASETDMNNGVNQLGPLYTNVVANEQDCFLKFIYSGTGTQYNMSDLTNHYAGHLLKALPFNGDLDNDSAKNGAEDYNGNKNLNDDNIDNDGILNVLDTDDDNDGILTINEDYNLNGNAADDDTNSNGIPDFLDNTNTLQIVENSISHFYIQPNPVNEILNISYTENLNQTVTIIDVNGRILKKYNNSPSLIDVSNFENGIYIILIQSDGKSSHQKFIKN